MPSAHPVVLVVEDDPLSADLLRTVLERAGYATATAATGAAGLARVERNGIDLVLLDLMLPDIDGLEVCRRLRTRPDVVYLPIIMVTALADEAQRRAGFAAGADDYVTKPFSPHELLDRVRVWLGTRRRLEAVHERLLDEQQRRQEEEINARLVEERAEQLAIMARMGKEAEGRARALGALHELAVAAGGVLDPPALAQLAVDHARDLLGVDAATLFCWDADAAQLRRLAYNGEERDGAALALRVGEGASGLAFERRAPVVVEDYTAWEHAVAAPVAHGVRTVAAVPLVMDDHPVGALGVRTYRRHHYAPEHIQLLALLAAQVGPALEAARLHAVSERRRVEAEALADLARRGAAEPNTERVIALVTEQACRLVGADYAAVALRGTDGATYWHGAWGTRSEGWRAPEIRRGRLGKGAVTRTLAAGHTLVFERLGENPELPIEWFPGHQSEGGRTVLSTPLYSHEEALGVLVMGWRSDATLQSRQLRLAEALASCAATILDNARGRTSLAASEERFRTLYQAIGCGVLVRCPSGEILEANQAAQQILGLSLEQMSGKRPRDLWQVFLEDDPETSDPDSLRRFVLSNRRPVRNKTLRLIRTDGEQRWLQVDTVPVLGPEGEPVQIVSSFIDITAHKQAEDRLRVRDRAIAATSNGIVITDARQPDRPIVFINPAYERLTGYTADEVLGRSPRFLRGPETDPAAIETLQAAMREERDCTVTVLHYRKDGTRFWNEVFLSPVRDGGGQVTHFVHVLVDVTERKEAEQQRQVLVQNEKLRALGQMASGVAHDLNQYLGLVAGHADLAQRALDRPGPDLDHLRDALRVIVQAAMDGAETVQRLQTFARPRQEGPAQRLDLGELLRDVGQLTAPQWRDAAQAQGRPIQLEVRTEGDTIVEGWPGSLREAITNLIFNAVDALPQGGSIVLVARRRGSRVEAVVTDSGIGMSRAVQARVFEPFFSTKGERGTGLGLAMVYSIVERHGGQITVDSAPGRGTTFRLSFPAATGAETVAPPPPAPQRVQPRRVLAIDDEPGLVRMVALMLTPEGHTVAQATSAEEALEHLATERFDVVISDLGLGAGMNGWDLAGEVQRRFPGVRFVLATGWGAEIDSERASEQGIHTVVAKPYRIADLKRVLASL